MEKGGHRRRVTRGSRGDRRRVMRCRKGTRIAQVGHHQSAARLNRAQTYYNNIIIIYPCRTAHVHVQDVHMHVHVHVLMVHAVIPIFGTTTVMVVIDSVVSRVYAPIIAYVFFCSHKS